VGVEEVRWNLRENTQLGTGFVMLKRIISAVRRVEFVSDRMAYIILRGCWCHIIVLKLLGTSGTRPRVAVALSGD
jgi:hypothetical protein